MECILAAKLIKHFRKEGYASEDRLGITFPEEMGGPIDLSDNVPTVIEGWGVFG